MISQDDQSTLFTVCKYSPASHKNPLMSSENLISQKYPASTDLAGSQCEVDVAENHPGTWNMHMGTGGTEVHIYH